jgi:hypothetical protein
MGIARYSGIVVLNPSSATGGLRYEDQSGATAHPGYPENSVALEYRITEISIQKPGGIVCSRKQKQSEIEWNETIGSVYTRSAALFSACRL